MFFKIPYKEVHPQIDESVFLADGSVVVGDVMIAAHSSVWFNTVIRGDVHSIRIGSYTNIQDLSMVHVSSNKASTFIGDEVTVGHRVILHGCHISNRVLVGMGAIVMDHAVVADNSIIGAGSLVTEGTQIPSGVLALGSPCKVKRDLTQQEIAAIEASAKHYAKVSQTYLRA